MNLNWCVVLGVLVCCFSAVPCAFGSGSSESDNSDLKVSPNPIEHLEGLVNYFKAAEERNREQEKVLEELKEQFKTLQSAQENCNEQVKSLSQKVDQLESRISSDRGVWLMTPPLRGPRGKQGENGENGQEGKAGVNGADGQPGNRGLPGSAGQPGAIGEKGAVGPPGKQGENGEKGQPGKDGEKGANGQPGQNGAQGPPGKPGDPGPKGDTGETGEKGQDGKAGTPGRDGTDGEKGAKGDRGISGHQPITSCSVAMEALPSPRSKKQTIYPHGNTDKVEVRCDFETDGGGWTIIQKRSSGPKQEFQKNWNEYKNGFGSVDKNHWIGLENIYALTKNGDQELRIDLEDHEGNKKYAKYSSFSVSGASDFYRLTISGFSGDAGDSMTNSNYNTHNGMRFSTKDKDNDNYPGGSCVAEYGGGGGWWFNQCSISSLNGLYFEKGETVPDSKGIYWFSWKGTWTHSLAKTEMKIRTRK